MTQAGRLELPGEAALRIELLARLRGGAAGFWLMLDYDGTLADFAPTPETILPDEELIALLARLARTPGLRLAIVSGRMLSHVQALVPVRGLALAGTYGVEIQAPSGEVFQAIDARGIGPLLETVKSEWQAAIAGHEGFYLEDKGDAIALHGRFATEADARQVYARASDVVRPYSDTRPVRILQGNRFLEICAEGTSKANAVRTILERFPFPGSVPIYFGDDDKDEEAFGEVKVHNGICVLVSPEDRPTLAGFRLPSPGDVRNFLGEIPGLLTKD